VRMCLITPVIGRKEVFVAERGMLDGHAVVLECDEKQARAIVQFLQEHFGGHRKMRAYVEGPRGGWKGVNLVGRAVQ